MSFVISMWGFVILPLLALSSHKVFQFFNDLKSCIYCFNFLMFELKQSFILTNPSLGLVVIVFEKLNWAAFTTNFHEFFNQSQLVLLIFLSFVVRNSSNVKRGYVQQFNIFFYFCNKPNKPLFSQLCIFAKSYHAVYFYCWRSINLIHMVLVGKLKSFVWPCIMG